MKDKWNIWSWFNQMNWLCDSLDLSSLHHKCTWYIQGQVTSTKLFAAIEAHKYTGLPTIKFWFSQNAATDIKTILSVCDMKGWDGRVMGDLQVREERCFTAISLCLSHSFSDWHTHTYTQTVGTYYPWSFFLPVQQGKMFYC